MDSTEIIALVGSWPGTLVLAPGPGSDAPEIAWGDVFFSYSPDGTVPRTQPFATIVTKDYPDDQTSRLDRPGVFRLSIAPGTIPVDVSAGDDPAELDRLVPHPVYGSLGWVAVLNPGPRTTATVRVLLRAAHDAARARYERRHQPR